MVACGAPGCAAARTSTKRYLIHVAGYNLGLIMRLLTGAGAPRELRILPISITQPNALEVVTWNTGEASDLRKVGNRSHAEFFEFIRDRTFDSIEIEISHSPCTACIDMLAGWLRKRMESGTTFSKPTIRKVGNRTYVGSPGRNLPNVPAVIRWGVLYDMPPQATTWQYLSDLYKAGWQLWLPGNALPGGTGSTPVHLL